MKWWPDAPAPGDMVRVKLGSVYHYGVFVGEDEVIQFGPPPVAGKRVPDAEAAVIATDMDCFCCGAIAETAVLDRKEQRQRIPPERTVALARSRLGEGGYDVLHNNCEHFAYACVFGEKRSTQEEAMRRKWNSRPVLDVYLAPIPAAAETEDIFPPERQQYTGNTGNEALRLARVCTWETLRYAADRSLRLRMEEMHFRLEKSGKWTCREMWFSLAHTDGWAAVAVSNGEVGVDLESVDRFLRRQGSDPGRLEKLAGKVCTRRERAEETSAAPGGLLVLWTQKEAIFKREGGRSFRPDRIETEKAQVTTCRVEGETPLVLSVCGEKLAALRVYRMEGGTAHLVPSENLLNGNDAICRSFAGP